MGPRDVDLVPIWPTEGLFETEDPEEEVRFPAGRGVVAFETPRKGGGGERMSRPEGHPLEDSES